MPESMGIDMWEIVPPAELGQPVCYAVRVYWLSVILSKQKALFSVVLTQSQPLRVLPCPVLPKELHRFCWQRNPTIRSRGFGRIFIYAYIRRVKDIVADMDAASREVNGIPFSPNTSPRRAPVMSSKCVSVFHFSGSASSASRIAATCSG